MNSVLRLRKMVGSTYRICVVWLILGALFLTWVTLNDLFHLEYPYGYYYYFAGLVLVVMHMVLVRTLRVAAQRIARRRLREAEPFYLRAKAWVAESDFDRAAVEYDSIVVIDPDNPRAYMGRGRVYDLLGKHDLAITDYTAAIEIDPFLRGLAHRPSAGDAAGKYDLAWGPPLPWIILPIEGNA